MQSNSYANSCFSICAARCGMDDEEFGLIGGSCIIGPDGRIIAEAQSEDDEIVYAEIDLAKCRPGKETVRMPFIHKSVCGQANGVFRHSTSGDIVGRNFTGD